MPQKQFDVVASTPNHFHVPCVTSDEYRVVSYGMGSDTIPGDITGFLPFRILVECLVPNNFAFPSLDPLKSKPPSLNWVPETWLKIKWTEQSLPQYVKGWETAPQTVMCGLQIYRYVTSLFLCSSVERGQISLWCKPGICCMIVAVLLSTEACRKQPPWSGTGIRCFVRGNNPSPFVANPSPALYKNHDTESRQMGRKPWSCKQQVRSNLWPQIGGMRRAPGDRINHKICLPLLFSVNLSYAGGNMRRLKKSDGYSVAVNGLK